MPAPGIPVQFNRCWFQAGDHWPEVGPGAKDDSLANKIHWLYYLVYDSVGNWIHYNIQNADVNGNNFGHLTDSLTPGHYTIIVAGSKSELDINDQYDSPFSLTPLPAFPIVNLYSFRWSLRWCNWNRWFLCQRNRYKCHPRQSAGWYNIGAQSRYAEINVPDAPFVSTSRLCRRVTIFTPTRIQPLSTYCLLQIKIHIFR